MERYSPKIYTAEGNYTLSFLKIVFFVGEERTTIFGGDTDFVAQPNSRKAKEKGTLSALEICSFQASLGKTHIFKIFKFH